MGKSHRNKAKAARRLSSASSGNGSKSNANRLPPSPPPSEPARDVTYHDPDVGFSTAVSYCPITAERPQAVRAGEKVPKPAIARANLAVSAERPEGSKESKKDGLRDMTVLQQHILFWDRDRDGEIYPWHTYRGFRDLGFNILLSVLSVFIIHGSFSYPTRLAFSLWPDPLFRVFVGGIHKAKHGSDTGVYDLEGRFVPQKFEDMFSKWDKSDSGSLSGRELWDMIRGNRLVADPFGWFAAVFEFGTTWLLLQEDGRVLKEDLRRTYDGSIFWKIKEAREKGKGWHKGYGLRNFLGFAEQQVKLYRE